MVVVTGKMEPFTVGPDRSEGQEMLCQFWILQFYVAEDSHYVATVCESHGKTYDLTVQRFDWYGTNWSHVGFISRT